MSQQSVPCLGEVETAITRIYCLMLDIFLVSVVLCISLFKNSYLSHKTQYIKNIFPYMGVSMILFSVLPQHVQIKSNRDPLSAGIRTPVRCIRYNNFVFCASHTLWENNGLFKKTVKFEKQFKHAL